MSNRNKICTISLSLALDNNKGTLLKLVMAVIIFLRFRNILMRYTQAVAYSTLTQLSVPYNSGKVWVIRHLISLANPLLVIWFITTRNKENTPINNFYVHYWLSEWQGHLTIQLISPLCCIYASVNQVSIGSDNGLSPIWHQAII